ncbi:MAG: hypothetical protein ACRCWS_09130 [Propionibacteriaceae bacterium]
MSNTTSVSGQSSISSSATPPSHDDTASALTIQPEVERYNFHQPVPTIIETPAQWRARRPWSVTAAVAIFVAVGGSAQFFAHSLDPSSFAAPALVWSMVWEARVIGIAFIVLALALAWYGKKWIVMALLAISSITAIECVALPFRIPNDRSFIPTDQAVDPTLSMGNSPWPTVVLLALVIACLLAVLLSTSRDWYGDGDLVVQPASATASTNP